MKIIIDRFEGDYAIAELPGGEMEKLAKCFIPEAREGDVVCIQIDCGETEKRKLEIQKLMDDVFE